MNNKADKKLQDAMLNMLAGLKDYRIQEEEKQYKKYWSEIKVPFSLKEGLGKYTKYELDEIRKTLQIKNVSNLKKDKLIDLLVEEIPHYLERIYLLWDHERFHLLTNIAGKEGRSKALNIEDQQIRYFRANGLIYTGVHEGEKILAVPTELIEQINALKSNVEARGTIKRNTEWIKLTGGLLYYYGTLNVNQLIEVLEKYTKEPLNLRDYFQVIHDANDFRKQFYIDEEGFSHLRVFDPKKVLQEHNSRKSLPFYPLTKDQLLTAGEYEFVERNKGYAQLVSFLTENFKIDKAAADQLAEECVYATKNGDSPNDVLQYLSSMLEFENKETLHKLIDNVVFLMNNTREWFLKGHTSTELSEVEKKNLQALPGNKNNSKRVEEIKVGRNDPCPCGSGKKYKKCCG